MKILLITPPRLNPVPADFPPLGLAFIGAVAKKEGHFVEIIDASYWTWNELLKEVKNSLPDIIGFTCWTIERNQVIQAAKLCKKLLKEVTIIIGGPHASAFPHHLLKRGLADIVVIGEGEETFREILNCISKNDNLSRVKGIAYKNGHSIVKTEKRALITDLDLVPFIMHEQFDYKKYNGLGDTDRVSAAIITSRGCPYRCIYCSSTVYWGNKYRKRSISNIIKEIKFLYHNKGIRALLFFDDNLTADRNHCIELCNAIKKLNYDLIWAAEGTVKVDIELLHAMKEAGCYRMDFGVESGSQTILNNIGKKFTVTDIKKAFSLCNEVGIRPNAYLMMGSPGESRKTVNETVKLMREIQPTLKSFRSGVWILPDTKLYEMSIQKKIIKEEDWLEDTKTYFYTENNSMRKIRSLGRQYERGMALSNGLVMYFKTLLRHFLFEIDLIMINVSLKFLFIDYFNKIFRNKMLKFLKTSYFSLENLIETLTLLTFKKKSDNHLYLYFYLARAEEKAGYLDNAKLHLKYLIDKIDESNKSNRPYYISSLYHYARLIHDEQKHFAKTYLEKLLSVEKNHIKGKELLEEINKDLLFKAV